MKERKRNIKGVTILEIMVVVAIVGILTTMSVVGFRNMTNHQKLISDTNNTAALLKYISSEAKTSRKPIRVKLDYTNEKITAWVDLDGDTLYDGGEIVLKEITMQEGIDLYGGMVGAAINTNQQMVHYYDDGTLEKNVTFLIKGETTGEFKAISINKMNGWPELITDVSPSLIGL